MNEHLDKTEKRLKYYFSSNVFFPSKSGKKTTTLKSQFRFSKLGQNQQVTSEENQWPSQSQSLNLLGHAVAVCAAL